MRWQAEIKEGPVLGWSCSDLLVRGEICRLEAGFARSSTSRGHRAPLGMQNVAGRYYSRQILLHFSPERTVYCHIRVNLQIGFEACFLQCLR